MAQVIVLGAGLNGLSTAMLLARDGHEVTVVERDGTEPPPAGQAWERWARSGVNQFRLPHYMLPRWREQMGLELPEVLDELRAVGGLAVNPLLVLPAAVRGPVQPGDERFDTMTARRPVLEAAVTTVAARTPGLTIERGTTVTGLCAEQGPGQRPPRITGVLTEGGRAIRADLVVDCGGRRTALASWLEALGARRPLEEREECGFVYYGRHLRSRTGELPEFRSNLIQHYDSVSILTLPADNGTWSVAITTSARDHALRALRESSTFDTVLARYPYAAHWRDGEPISGVDVMAGIEDRYRRLVVDGEPVATGVVAVGDAWASTNPSLGRGASIGLLHARCLRDLLRDVDPAEPEKLSRQFDEVTTATVEPLYRLTLWFDRHRLAEIDADIAATPYAPEDQRWSVTRATYAAGLTDPEIARAYASISSLVATPTEVYAEPGILDRILRLGTGGPRYPLPGPDRREVLTAIG